MTPMIVLAVIMICVMTFIIAAGGYIGGCLFHPTLAWEYQSKDSEQCTGNSINL